jgi:hypothetical protein
VHRTIEKNGSREETKRGERGVKGGERGVKGGGNGLRAVLKVSGGGELLLRM